LRSSGLFCGDAGREKLKKILDDARGATGLAMCEVELALGALFDAFFFAQKFGNAENGGKRIVQFMSGRQPASGP